MNTSSEASRPSDQALAARVQNLGDERAFRSLYRRHTPALYPFVLRLLGGVEADAEDVVQETWLHAVGSLRRFRWESSFRTWLLGIGLNQSRDVLRRRARAQSARPRADSVARYAPAEERMDLERAIASLPDGYRSVLLLHDVQGFTHEEISERLEIAVGTSRSQLHHARRALRGLLEPPVTMKETS